MTTTYTSNKHLALQGTGDNPNTWGTVLNTSVFTVLDNNLGGRLIISVAGNTDVTLTQSQADNIRHKLTGVLTGNINYIFPNQGGIFIIENATTGSFTVTVKPTAGSGIVIPQGTTMLVFINPDTTAAASAFNTISSLGILGLLDLSAAAAGQVKFPATQNPSSDVNTLDDYEEGTWTPGLTFVTPGDLNIVYAQQVGRYVKVGKLVTLWFSVATSTFTFTTASGNMNITGVPFTFENSQPNAIGSMEFGGGVTKAGYTQLNSQIQANTAIIVGFASGSGVVRSQVTAADMPTGGSVVLAGSIQFVATA